MKLTIIIPCFNIREYIDRSLKSVIQQKGFEEIEVLIIDDGSTDDLYIKIKFYTNKYRNIKYFRKINTGLSDTRNMGIDLANGEYLMFLDGDDFLEENLYYDLKEKLDGKIDIINFGHCQINSEYKLIKNYTLKKYQLTPEDFIKYSFMTSACTKIIRKKFLQKNNIYFLTGIWYEDVNFVLKIVFKTQEIYNTEKIYYNYVQRENSITKTFNEKILDIFKCLDDLFEFFKKNNIKLNKKINKCIKIEYGKIHHYSRLVRVDKKMKRKIYKETIKYWEKYEIANKLSDSFLFLDVFYFKGIFGRIYFKFISKVKLL